VGGWVGVCVRVHVYRRTLCKDCKDLHIRKSDERVGRRGRSLALRKSETERATIKVSAQIIECARPLEPPYVSCSTH